MSTPALAPTPRNISTNLPPPPLRSVDTAGGDGAAGCRRQRCCRSLEPLSAAASISQPSGGTSVFFSCPARRNTTTFWSLENLLSENSRSSSTAERCCVNCEGRASHRGTPTLVGPTPSLHPLPDETSGKQKRNFPYYLIVE